MSQTAKKREVHEALQQREAVRSTLEAFDQVRYYLTANHLEVTELEDAYSVLEQRYVEHHQRALAMAAELRTPKDSFSGLSLHPWRPRKSISKETL